MKQLITIIIISSLLYPGTVYLSMDVQNHYGYHSDFIDIDTDNSFDNGSILLGYHHTVFQQDQFGLNLGFSFTVSSSKDEDSNDELDTETDFYSLYIMPNFTLSEKFFSLGSKTIKYFILYFFKKFILSSKE